MLIRPRLACLLAVLLAALGVARPAVAQEIIGYPRGDGRWIEAKVLETPGASCAPLAIISHGLGGTSRGNTQLAAALNVAGFRVVVPSHPESGPSLLRETVLGGNPRADIIRNAADRRLLQLRLDDIGAILAEEGKRCAAPFKVLAGHSMGARIVALEAGAGNAAGIRGQDRFDAYVAVSLAPEGTTLFPHGAMASIRKPFMIITGTRDQSESGSYDARRNAFGGLAPGRKRFAVIDGAGHFALGGAGDPRIGRTVGELAAAFARDVRPGPWRAAAPIPGVAISEK